MSTGKHRVGSRPLWEVVYQTERSVADSGRQLIELFEPQVRGVPRVAGETLVTSIAIESDGHVLSGELRQVIRWHG